MFFVGYPRSGHSLIGALLDAHPNVVVSHEASALELVKAGRDRNFVFGSILAKASYFSRTGNRWSGYSYRVPDQLQGAYENLQVIGDKKGGESSRLLAASPDLADTLGTFGCRVRVIHVVRNPFDNIVSRAAGGNSRQREVTPRRLHRATVKQLTAYRNNEALFASLPFPVHTLFHEQFVANPKRELAKLHEFLGTVVDTKYLEDCASIVAASPPSRRDSIAWPNDLLDAIYASIRERAFLERYLKRGPQTRQRPIEKATFD